MDVARDAEDMVVNQKGVASKLFVLSGSKWFSGIAA